ncbi:MAG: hypothetical protein ACJZ18_04345 [Methylophilaceae bacterium]
MFSKIFIILLMFINPQLIAAPMSYKGSITTMGEASKHFSKVESNYALTGKDSIGIKAFKLKGDGYDGLWRGIILFKASHAS